MRLLFRVLVELPRNAHQLNPIGYFRASRLLVWKSTFMGLGWWGNSCSTCPLPAVPVAFLSGVQRRAP